MGQDNRILEYEKYQEQSAKWIKLLVDDIAIDIEKKAQELKVIQRRRKIICAVDLLRMLLIYTISATSLKKLSIYGALLQICDMSDNAWRKQMLKANSWLTWIVSIIIEKTLLSELRYTNRSRNIYAVDTTSIRQSGKEGLVWRIHMKYDLLNGCMNEPIVSDHHVAESLEHFQINRRDIYLTDAGYGKRSQYCSVISNGADIITRISLHLFKIMDKTGNQINVVDILKKSKKNIVEIRGFVTQTQESVPCPVRIVASRIPDDKVEKVIKRKKRNSQKNSAKIMPETLESAKWVILATSLDDRYSNEEILSIYRLRWQVELFFKRFKQHLTAHNLTVSTRQHAVTVILLWLIVWSLTEKQAIRLEQLITEHTFEQNRISFWTICSFAYMAVSNTINGNCVSLDFSQFPFSKFLNSPRVRTCQLYDFSLCTFLILAA